jgi:hypothetical protein
MVLRRATRILAVLTLALVLCCVVQALRFRHRLAYCTEAASRYADYYRDAVNTRDALLTSARDNEAELERLDGEIARWRDRYKGFPPTEYETWRAQSAERMRRMRLEARESGERAAEACSEMATRFASLAKRYQHPFRDALRWTFLGPDDQERKEERVRRRPAVPPDGHFARLD